MQGIGCLSVCWALFFFSVLFYTPPATIAWVVCSIAVATWSLFRYINLNTVKVKDGDEPF